MCAEGASWADFTRLAGPAVVWEVNACNRPESGVQGKSGRMQAKAQTRRRDAQRARRRCEEEDNAGGAGVMSGWC